jgi:Transcriptional regulatory protein, C terminal
VTVVDGPLAVEVALLHWPRERDRREQLASTMRPRLLLVGTGDVPPAEGDELEDWVRLPADERDVAARMYVLSERAAASLRAIVVVDGCLLRRGGGQVELSPSEAALAQRLARTPGELVARAELAEAVWPDGPSSEKSLDDLAYRLRRRLPPLGLDLLAARGRGFVLSTLPPIDASAAE